MEDGRKIEALVRRLYLLTVAGKLEWKQGEMQGGRHCKVIKDRVLYCFSLYKEEDGHHELWFDGERIVCEVLGSLDRLWEAAGPPPPPVRNVGVALEILEGM